MAVLRKNRDALGSEECRVWLPAVATQATWPSSTHWISQSLRTSLSGGEADDTSSTGTWERPRSQMPGPKQTRRKLSFSSLCPCLSENYSEIKWDIECGNVLFLMLCFVLEIFQVFFKEALENWNTMKSQNVSTGNDLRFHLYVIYPDKIKTVIQDKLYLILCKTAFCQLTWRRKCYWSQWPALRLLSF